MTEANTLTDTQRLAIRAKLAQAMGFNVYIVTHPLGIEWYVQDSDHDGDRFLPDPFTSAADKDALVKWFADNKERWPNLKANLRKLWYETPKGTEWERWLMTLPLETITLAAAAALGITAPPPAAAPPLALPEAPRRE